MRWFPVLILAYVALGLQAGLSGYVEIYRARPNLVLIVVVFIASNAPRNVGLLACLVIGAMHDLLGVGPWGVAVVAYGLTAVAILATQEFVYQNHFLTHFTLVLLGGWLEAIVRLVHGLVYLSIHPHPNWMRPGGLALFAGAIYTAVLGVPIIFVLQRMRRAFGFRPMRRGPIA